MHHSTPVYATLEDWIQAEAIRFSTGSPASFHAAVDRMLATLGPSLQLLGMGEALHGGEEILILRNHLFQHLVEAHGYSAIAIESSFPRARIINDYISGRNEQSYEAVQEAGFSHGFGKLEANRELVEWMRHYNADPSHPIKLRFYGFDSPTEMTSSDSPRQLLEFVLDYLASMDDTAAQAFRQRIVPLLGQDAEWENPAASFDPAQSIGLSPAATALRIETEELIAELHRRRPELVAKSNSSSYAEALHYASLARQMLTYHAGLARPSNNRIAHLLGLRDVMMADNLAYIVAREQGRGKVLAFAHNSHLRRGVAQWQLGPDLLTWWPAGAHLDVMLGLRYAVVGSAVGVSEANGISQPEAGTLEERLTRVPGPVRLIPTYKGQGLAPAALTDIPIRSGSRKNTTYFPLTPQGLEDFDWLLVLDSVSYTRGGPPLPE